MSFKNLCFFSGSDTDSLCGFSFEELNSVPEYKPHECPHCTERYLWGHQLREHMKVREGSIFGTKIQMFWCA